ncbi:lytic polysaccharide monooxygenase [Oerskovia sp. M15]
MFAVVLGVAAIAAPIIVAPSASAHGWITSPPSRQGNCATGATSFDCGGIKYEPQSVEAPKGSMKCSGGSGFTILDDTSKPWPRKSVGSTVTFQWNLTAAHNTSTWEYFVDGQLHQTFSQGGAQPQQHRAHADEPAGRQPHGPRTLERVQHRQRVLQLRRHHGQRRRDDGWDHRRRHDRRHHRGTTGGSTGTGTCTAAAWVSGSVYTGGARVSYDNKTYEAKWWTTGENPGASGQWGVEGPRRLLTRSTDRSARRRTGRP